MIDTPIHPQAAHLNHDTVVMYDPWRGPGPCIWLVRYCCTCGCVAHSEPLEME